MVLLSNPLKPQNELQWKQRRITDIEGRWEHRLLQPQRAQLSACSSDTGGDERRANRLKDLEKTTQLIMTFTNTCLLQKRASFYTELKLSLRHILRDKYLLSVEWGTTRLLI